MAAAMTISITSGERQPVRISGAVGGRGAVEVAGEVMVKNL
ncbi:hypothetical protein GCM10007285_10810 [Stappia taiwanensis]|nr:hypothetical protein GCM10007285_10810 [Stappia taiwanensis]